MLSGAGPGIRQPVSGCASPSMAIWNRKALASIATPIRVVCFDGSSFKAAAMFANTSGASTTARDSSWLTASTARSISSAACWTACSLTVTCSHNPARSSTPPMSHPDDGNHSTPPLGRREASR